MFAIDRWTRLLARLSRAWLLPATILVTLALPAASIVWRTSADAKPLDLVSTIVAGTDDERLAARAALRGPDVAALIVASGISIEMLQVLLLIPPAFLLTLFVRHVVGIETLGAFLPVLLAAAAIQIGLGLAIAGLVLVTLVAGLARFGLEALGLLRLPKMGALLTIVVVVLVSVAALGSHWGVIAAANLTLFPIVILTFTVERLAQTFDDEGLKPALKLLAGTCFVICLSYLVLANGLAASILLAFPEVLAVVFAAQVMLGRYTGIRVTEVLRFRRLILAEEAR